VETAYTSIGKREVTKARRRCLFPIRGGYVQVDERAESTEATGSRWGALKLLDEGPIPRVQCSAPNLYLSSGGCVGTRSGSR